MFAMIKKGNPISQKRWIEFFFGVFAMLFALSLGDGGGCLTVIYF